MSLKTVGLILGLLFTGTGHAATWYGFSTVATNNAVIFFDADSVVKKNGTVAIWIKYVNEEQSPAQDGSYASAYRTNYSCTNRTTQSTTAVLYDKNQNVIRTWSGTPTPDAVVPGSVGESILQLVCSPSFPNPKSNDYALVGDNDIYAAAKRLFSLRYDPAPK